MNVIAIDDIKMIIGELVIENHMLKNRLEQLRLELEEIKKRIADESNPQKQGGEKKEKGD